MRPWEAEHGLSLRTLKSVRPNSDSLTDLTDLTDQIDQMCHKSLTSCFANFTGNLRCSVYAM